MTDIHRVIRRPVITEKSTDLKTDRNQIVFEVDRGANKIEIKKAIERLFKVKVMKVRTMTVRGKIRRVGKNVGYKSNWKKAIVTLREGDAIDFFEGA